MGLNITLAKFGKNPSTRSPETDNFRVTSGNRFFHRYPGRNLTKIPCDALLLEILSRMQKTACWYLFAVGRSLNSKLPLAKKTTSLFDFFVRSDVLPIASRQKKHRLPNLYDAVFPILPLFAGLFGWSSSNCINSNGKSHLVWMICEKSVQSR